MNRHYGELRQKFKKGLSWFGHLIGSWLSQLLRPSLRRSLSQHQASVELCVEYHRFKAGLNQMFLSKQYPLFCLFILGPGQYFSNCALQCPGALQSHCKGAVERNCRFYITTKLDAKAKIHVLVKLCRQLQSKRIMREYFKQ